jgi:hypothetical protein
MQTAVQWDKNVLENVFRELYSRAMTNRKDYIPLMFGVESSTKTVESIEMIGGEGLMEEWGMSGNSVKYEDVNELWQKYFRHIKYSDGRTIERDFIDDLKLTAIKDRITSLADSVYKTQQLQAVEWFNNMDQTSAAVNFRGRTYNATLPDTKALVASDHPYSPTDTTAQSNKGVLDLSIDAWDTTAIAMQEWKDDKGNPLVVIPDTLIVAPYNARKAFQIAGMPGKEVAKYDPDQANYNINIYQGEVTVIVNPYINPTKRKNWVAADGSRMKRAQKWFNRRKVENGSITDFDTEISKYKAIGRWSYGCIDWSWGFGHIVP